MSSRSAGQVVPTSDAHPAPRQHGPVSGSKWAQSHLDYSAGKAWNISFTLPSCLHGIFDPCLHFMVSLLLLTFFFSNPFRWCLAGQEDVEIYGDAPRCNVDGIWYKPNDAVVVLDASIGKYSAKYLYLSNDEVMGHDRQMSFFDESRVCSHYFSFVLNFSNEITFTRSCSRRPMAPRPACTWVCSRAASCTCSPDHESHSSKERERWDYIAGKKRSKKDQKINK